jgi:hypothetical protein
MNGRNTRRAFAAAVSAVALAGVGLVGVASAANAVDSIPSDPKVGGSFYLADGNTAADLTPGSSAIDWEQGLAALPAVGDWTNSVGPVPSGAAEVYDFLAPQGQESNISAWNAYTSSGIGATGQWLENVSPSQLLNGGTGTPSGQAAVAAAGGDYSLGIAYTTSNRNAVVPGGLFFVHIHVTAGSMTTATFTYQPVKAAVVKTASTTTLSSDKSAVQSGEAFNLTATVQPATATGTVTFKSGSTTLGTAPVSGGTATLAGATLANATTSAINAQVTAVYSGDSTYDTSASTATTISVTPGPIATTTTVAAVSNSGDANRPVQLTATVSPVSTAGAGTVVFTGSVDGGAATTIATVPVNASGVATTTVSSLAAGAWTINAAFTGVAPYQDSAAAAAATLSLNAVSIPADQRSTDSDVTVTIPAGTLTITTPFTTVDPLDLGTAILDDATSTFFTDPAVFGSATDQAAGIQVIDRRAGAPGFTAQVKSTDFTSGANSFPASHLALNNLGAHQVAGNTLQASDVKVTNLAGLSGTAQTFASYAAGKATGTAWISGDVALSGVPSSVQPGQYKATLTFTVL